MKVVVDRQRFTEAFTLAASGGAAKSPKEILQNVKVVASLGKLTLMATDMETGIMVNMQGDVTIDREGSVLLPIMRTGTMLRESTDDSITIEADEDAILVKGARSKYRFPSSNPDEFPGLPDMDSQKYHEVAPRALAMAMTRTVFACDTESSRFALGGLKIESNQDGLNVIATDGRRLCKMEIVATAFADHQFAGSVIVPQRAVRLIQRAVADCKESVQVSSRINDILFQTESATVYTRLIEGRYPDWTKVIPNTDNFKSVEISAGTLLASVRQAAIVTDNESKAVDIAFGENTMTIEASAADIGESKIEVPVEFDHEPVKLRLDSRYVIDICKVIDLMDTVTIWFSTPSTPVMFTTTDNYVGVIMPMSA